MKNVTFDYEYLDEDENTKTRKLTMKSSRMIPNGVMRQITARPADSVYLALDWAMSEKDRAWYDTIPSEINDYGKKITDAWNKASGADLGESQAS